MARQARTPDATRPAGGETDRASIFSVRSLDDRGGLEVRDRVEDARFELHTGCRVSPSPGDPEAVGPPVDTTLSVTTDAVSVPGGSDVFVRDRADDELVAACENGMETVVPPGDYEVEFTTTPVKTYLAADSMLGVKRSEDRTTVSLQPGTEVTIGLRSFHDAPAATVRTTGDPHDLMRAVSTFGSALKTTSPERSFPTLRGHPPALDLGDELDVPAAVEPPETGVQVSVPATREAVMAVAPLAFYLGAEVVPGEPAIHADGRSFPLVAESDARGDTPATDRDASDFASAANRTLRRHLTLDALVRTAGRYDVSMVEAEAVDADLDRQALYHAPLAERVARYEEVPWEAVADAVPTWPLTATVSPDTTRVPALPHLAERLALVRTPSGEPGPAPDDPPAAVADFCRAAVSEDAVGESEDENHDASVFQPEPAETPGNAWVGDGVPAGASAPTVESYRRSLAHEASGGDVSVLVVRNDESARMTGEDAVAGYGDHEWADVSAEAVTDVTVAELRRRLEADDAPDFLHYVGHVDERGLRCVDGWLDCRTLSETALRAFLLNGCRSAAQGRALCDAGAVAGVVTTTDVHNGVAETVGRSLARLFDVGFSLNAALDVVQQAVLSADRYAVLGDGTVRVCQHDGAAPKCCWLDPVEDGYEITVTEYPVAPYGPGAFAHSFFDDEAHLVGGERTYTVEAGELPEVLARGKFPVFVDGELCWSVELREE